MYLQVSLGVLLMVMFYVLTGIPGCTMVFYIITSIPGFTVSVLVLTGIPGMFC